MVATCDHIRCQVRVVYYDHVFQGRNLSRSPIRNGLHIYGLSPALEAIRGEERFGVCICQSSCYSSVAKAGEQRQNNAADLGNCQHGNYDLTGHGHK